MNVSSCTFNAIIFECYKLKIYMNYNNLNNSKLGCIIIIILLQNNMYLYISFLNLSKTFCKIRFLDSELYKSKQVLKNFFIDLLIHIQ